ncbi:MAG TPA: ABC transporter substrate-binding protein [Rhodoblastus sp.]|nr:ABC transporter substrate-binding protein [Rhodoblastus sp.]
MAGQNGLRSIVAAFALVGLATLRAQAGEYVGPGVTKDEIVIGNTAPYSGPVSALGTTIKSAEAYFRKVNDEGGVNGRKIRMISYDDGYSPPKTVEQTRRLVESDGVLLVFGSLGTPTSAAVQKYLNSKAVPQLFVMSGAARFHDPATSPWSMGWPLSLTAEGAVLAQFLATGGAPQKLAVLFQNDDFGRDCLAGLKAGLGSKASTIVAETSYDVGAPTIDSQLLQLKASGATAIALFTTPKYSAQAIRKIAELQWKANVFIPQSSASAGSVLAPAGIDNAQGVMSWASYKDPTETGWKDDPGMKAWLAFMERYYPEGDRTDISNVVGYLLAKTLVATLQRAGDDLSRANVLKQASQLKGLSFDMLLPGITIDTARTPYSPLTQVQMERFTGRTWERFGPIVHGGATAN